MPTTSITVKNRSNTPVPLGGLRLACREYRRQTIGGCKDALLDASGTTEALWSLVGWLGYRVEVRDRTNTLRWWGEIASVALRVGPYLIKVSIDTLANRVAVAYEEVVPGQEGTGERRTTDWAEDLTSIGVYGVKDLILTRSSTTTEAAERERDAALSLGRLPQVGIELVTPNEVASAEIECRGDWSRLDWHYPVIDAPGLRLLDGGTDEVLSIPTVEGTPILGQALRFIADGIASWVLPSVWLRLFRIGNPTSALFISLAADNSGSIGAIRAQTTIGASSLGENDGTWVEIPFPARPTLTPGTAYWLICSVPNTAGCDAGNAYRLEYSSSDLAVTTTLQQHQGGWASRTGDWYVQFGGLIQTSDLIAYLIAQAAPQFSVQIAASGVYDIPNEIGDNSARTIVENLMELGSTRSLRLVATVDEERRVIVSDEPSESSARYYLDGAGELRRSGLVSVPPEECVAGEWVRLVGVLPPVAALEFVNDPTAIFIEEGEFRDDPPSWKPRARGQKSVFDL